MPDSSPARFAISRTLEWYLIASLYFPCLCSGAPRPLAAFLFQEDKPISLQARMAAFIFIYQIIIQEFFETMVTCFFLNGIKTAFSDISLPLAASNDGSGRKK